MRLEGKVALVTGGTRGIGQGIVEMLAAEGAAVAFTGRSEDAGRAVEAAVNDAGGRVMYVRADNGVEEQIAGAVAATVERFGCLTTLVNNAIASDDVGSGKDSHVDEIDNDTFAQILRIALMGSVWAAKYAIPEMRKAGSGSDREHLGELVEVGAAASARVPRVEGRHQRARRARWRSTTARTTSAPTPSSSASSTPGRRRWRRSSTTRRTGPRSRRTSWCRASASLPTSRPGVVYLASDESKYVTGIELTIDGGALCHQALPELDFEGMRAGQDRVVELYRTVERAARRPRPGAGSRRADRHGRHERWDAPGAPVADPAGRGRQRPHRPLLGRRPGRPVVAAGVDDRVRA